MRYIPRFIEGKTVEELEQMLTDMAYEEYGYSRGIDHTLVWDIQHTIRVLKARK